MAEAFTPLAALELVAAAFQLVLAGFVLAGAPKRVENRLVATMLLLGAGAVSVRAAQSLSGAPLGGPLAATLLDLSFPGSNLVLLLALRYPYDRMRTPGRRALFHALVALLVAASLWVVLVKRPFYEVGSQGTWSSAWPWGVLADDLDYYVTLLAAGGLFAAAYVGRPRGSTDRAAEFMLIAFSLGALASVPMTLSARGETVATGQAFHMDLPDAAKNLVQVLGSVGFVAGYALVLALARRRGHSIRAPLVGGLAALGIGIAFVALGHGRALTIVSLGSFGEFAAYVVRPPLLAYALLRYQTLHMEARVKRSFMAILGVLTVGFLFLPIEEAVRLYAPLPRDLAAAAGVAVGLAVTLLLYARVQALAAGAGDAVFRNVRTDDDSRYVASKRRELYAVAIERAYHDGLLDTPSTRSELDDMRTRLRISEDEHDEIMRDVRERAKTAPPRPWSGRNIEPGALLVGRYRVLARLGDGGSGSTFRCRDERLGREVAVKVLEVLDPSSRRRAVREAKLLARVRHPHVVALHDVHEDGERTLLVMDLVAGGTLADLLAAKRGAPLDAEEARRITRDVLDALVAIHEAGIVHRDLKPANVLLEPDGTARVADLGIAREEHDVTGTAHARPGTPAYMAPEQVLGLEVDARTDLYAAGVLLHEMLTGSSYVKAAAREGILPQEAIVSRPAPLPLPGAPEWANHFLARALAKDKALRHASARDARDALTRGTAEASAPRG